MLRSVRVRSSSGRAGPGLRGKPPPSLATRADSEGCQPELVPGRHGQAAARRSRTLGAEPGADARRAPETGGPWRATQPRGPVGGRPVAATDHPPRRLPVRRRLGQIPGYMRVAARRLRIKPESLRMHRPLNSAPGSLELSGNEGKCSQWHAQAASASGTRTSTACTGSVWEFERVSASRICLRYPSTIMTTVAGVCMVCLANGIILDRTTGRRVHRAPVPHSSARSLRLPAPAGPSVQQRIHYPH